MSLSNYAENEVLKYLLGKGQPPVITGAFVALFDGDPTDAGDQGTEVTLSVRPTGRIDISTNISVSNGQASNDSDIDFGVVANNTNVTHFAFFDGATGGNMIASGALDEAYALETNQGFIFRANSVNLTLD
jgi:hypothetical protein